MSYTLKGIITLLLCILLNGFVHATSNNLPNYFNKNFTSATFFLTGPDTDGDGIDDLDDLDADNDGILNIEELSCSTTPEQLIFANHWAAGVDPIGTAATPPTVFSGTTVTLERRDPMNIVRIEAGGTGINVFNGVNSYKLRQTSVANGTSEHIFKFSNPVSNLVMATIDVDASDINAYTDNVTFNGYSNGEIYSIQPADIISGVANTFNSGQNSFTGTAVTATYPEGLAQVTFPVPIDSVVIVYFNTGTNPENNQAISFQASFDFCEVRDTDNDGTPDYLDLDSDNDGCPDALEGDGGFTVLDIQNDTLTGGVDANGIPTVATSSGQNFGSSRNDTQQMDACQDADFDGIGDINDLDDDNDGILDTQELCGTDPITPSTSDINISINLDQYPTEISWNISGPTGIVATGGPYTTADANTTVTDLVNVSENGAYTFTIFDTYGDGLQGNTYTLSGTDFTTITTPFADQGLVNTPISQSENFQITSAVNSIFSCLAADPAADSDNDGTPNYQDADFCTLNANGVCTSLDLDGDGIINSLDLDTDADGCPDAIEGGGTFTYANLQNDTLAGGVDNEGIPVVATSTGQSVNTSNDANQTAAACITIAENDINQTPQDFNVGGNILTNDADPTGDNQTVQSATGLNASGQPITIPLDGTPTDVYDENGILAGTIALNPNGIYDFDPTPTFTGDVPVEYVVVDDNGNTDPATLTIQVIPADSPTQNEPPVATDDTNTTLIDTDVAGNVILPNDTDPENDPLSLTAALADTDGDGLVDETLPVGVATPIYGTDDLGNTILAGTMTLNNDGTYNFDPTPTFTGDVPVDYTITDGNGGSDDATLTITILPNDGNDTFTNDDASVDNQGITQASNVITNDNDPEGNTQTVSTATASNSAMFTVDGTTANPLPSGGTLIIDPNGDYTYQPEPDFIGTEVVTYLACDNGTPQACDTATLYLTTLPVNVTIAENDINQTPQDFNVGGNILTNDTDPTGDNQTVQSATGLNASGQPITIPLDGTPTDVYDENGILAGTIALNPNGIYDFDPTPTFTGDVPVEYVVVDDNGNTDPATLTIQVIPADSPTQNEPPVATDDTNTTLIDTDVAGNVILPNDTDPENDPLSLTAALADTDGDGLVDETLPVGVATPIYGTDDLGNTILAGTMTLNNDGTYNFDPTPTFTGDVPVDYTITDGNGGSDDATLTITILPNDGNDTFTNDDASVDNQGITQASNVITNDNDPEGNTQTVSTATASNSAMFTVDGTTANPLPSGGTLIIDPNGDYTYQPEPDFIGTEVVTYLACDNGTPQACDTATLYLTTLPVNVTIAENDINQTPQDVNVGGNILTNDTDPTGDNQTVQSATGLNASGQPITIPLDGTPTDVYDENGILAGTIALNPNGIYDFDPTPTFTGDVPVEYVVVDDNGNTDPATLTIQVIPADSPTQNEPPVATDDTNTTPIDTDVAGNVISPNDTDPENDPLSLTAALADTDGDGLMDETLPVGVATPIYGTDDLGNTVLAGTMTLNNDGTYNFDPTPTFTGDVPVDYTITDGNGGSDDATLTITILPNDGNDTFTNDDASVDNQGITQANNIITNDNDPEGNTQTVSTATASNSTMLTVDGTTANPLPSGGTLIIDPNGDYTYQPEPDFIGTEVVTYLACDNGTPQACDTATLYLTTLPVNSIDSKDDFNNTPFETPVMADVSTNDIDEEGNNQTFTLNDVNGGMDPAEGTVVLNADGSYTFTPATGFSGETFYEYSVCDDGAPMLCDTSTVYLEVLPAVSPETTQIIANPDANFLKMDETGTGNVLVNDLDPDDLKPSVTTPLINSIVAGTDGDGNPVANAGNLTLNPDGTYTFVPSAGFTGTVTQPYTICNSEAPGVCDDTELIITVVPETENTTFASDDAAITDAGVTVSDDISLNDTDSESDNQTITDYLIDTDGDGKGDTPGTIGTPTTVGGTNDQGVFVANAGSLTLNIDGTYSFTPATDFVGNVNVPYTACDDNATIACADATLVITVQDVNRDYGDGPATYPAVWHRALTDSNDDNIPDGPSDIWLGEQVGFENISNNGNDQFDDAISFGAGAGDFPLIAVAGTSYDVDITVNSSKIDTVYYAMWIDWDEDGIYDDFYTDSQITTGYTSETATVSVLAPAIIGSSVNVRLRADDSPFSPTDFSGGKTNGEAEDFQALVVLPVELTIFNGKAAGCHIELNWHAATEENFSHYEIERSGDGQLFTKIKTIKGTGGPGTGVWYNFTDKQAAEFNYYRMKMVDLDGSYEYSKTINVATNCAHDYKLELYPNPTNSTMGVLNLNFFSNAEEVQIQITDMQGKIVQKMSIGAVTNELNTVQFDISSLPSGTYSLNILGGFKESSKIFIITND